MKVFLINFNDEVKKIQKSVNEISKELEKGIKFDKERKVKGWKKDTEILRLYDWGQIHLTWEKCRTPKLLNKKLNHLLAVFEGFMVKDSQKIFSMNLNYSIPIELFKKIYIMGEVDAKI